MVSTATTGSTRSRAASASPDGVGRGNAETGTRPGIDEIYLDRTTGTKQAFFDQEFEGVIFVHLVVCLWLIQSQSQGGTGSATLHQGDTKGRIYIVLLHVLLEFFYCQCCDAEFRHVKSSLFSMAKGIVCGCHGCFRGEAVRLRHSKISPKRSQLTTPRKFLMTRFSSIKEFSGDGKEKRLEICSFSLPCQNME